MYLNFREDILKQFLKNYNQHLQDCKYLCKFFSFSAIECGFTNNQKYENLNRLMSCSHLLHTLWYVTISNVFKCVVLQMKKKI